MKDWTGNQTSIFKTLGASNHTDADRQIDDYYATDPVAMKLLLELETFNNSIWEPACGEGHLSKVLESNGYTVLSTDLVDRGYGKQVDFLKTSGSIFSGDIITNPPYKYAQKFIEKSLEVIPEGNKVAMFLKVQFLEGKARKELFKMHPPKTVYVSSSRIECGLNGVFKKESAVAYAWFVWVKGYKGITELKWFN